MRVFWWPFIIFITLVTSFSVLHTITPSSIILAIVLCLAASIGCLHNDMRDSVCDEINQNNGNGHSITPKQKHTYQFVLLLLIIATLIISMPLGTAGSIYVLLTILLVLLYNQIQYHTPLAVLFSSITAITPILLPIILWSSLTTTKDIMLICSILFFVISREMVADINDYAGDIQAGKKTLAVVIGPQKALRIVRLITAVMLITIIITLFSSISIISEIFIIAVMFVTFFDKQLTEGNAKKYMTRTRYITLLAPFLFL